MRKKERNSCRFHASVQIKGRWARTQKKKRTSSSFDACWWEMCRPGPRSICHRIVRVVILLANAHWRTELDHFLSDMASAGFVPSSWQIKTHDNVSFTTCFSDSGQQTCHASVSLFHWENGKRRQKYERPEKRGESLGEAMINLRVLVFFLAASFSSHQRLLKRGWRQHYKYEEMRQKLIQTRPWSCLCSSCSSSR